MKRRSLAIALALILVGGTVIAAQSTAQMSAQLAFPKLASTPTVTIDLAGKPLKDVVTAMGVSARYHSAISGLDEAASVKLSNSTLEDGLRTVLGAKHLAFKATSQKSVFVYPDTPENRSKYTESVKEFTIAKAPVNRLVQTLNQSLTFGADDLRPTIVSDNESRTIAARATPDVMAKIAKIIADNDK